MIFDQKNIKVLCGTQIVVCGIVYVRKNYRWVPKTAQVKR